MRCCECHAKKNIWKKLTLVPYSITVIRIFYRAWNGSLGFGKTRSRHLVIISKSSCRRTLQHFIIKFIWRYSHCLLIQFCWKPPVSLLRHSKTKLLFKYRMHFFSISKSPIGIGLLMSVSRSENEAENMVPSAKWGETNFSNAGDKCHDLILLKLGWQ